VTDQPTPLARKLGIRAGDTVVVVGAPPGWVVPDLPAGVRVRRSAHLAGGRGTVEAQVVVAFFTGASSLRRSGPALARRLAPTAGLWIAWPRRAAGHESDLSSEVVRATLLATGLVDVKVAALGEDWSGHRFVRRVAPRPS
jgi:hypothetical protein